MHKRTDPWSHKKKRKRQKRKDDTKDKANDAGSETTTGNVRNMVVTSEEPLQVSSHTENIKSSETPLDEQDMHNGIPTIKQECIVNCPSRLQTLMLSTSLMPSFGLLPSQKLSSLPIVIKEETVINSDLGQSDPTGGKTGTENEVVNKALSVEETGLTKNDEAKEVSNDTSNEVDLPNVKLEKDIVKEIVDYTAPEEASFVIVKIESDFCIENTEEDKTTEIFNYQTEKDDDIEIIGVFKRSCMDAGKTSVKREIDAVKTVERETVTTVKREIDDEVEIIGSVKAKKKLLTIPDSNQEDDVILIGECVLEKEKEPCDITSAFENSENLCGISPSSTNENTCPYQSITPEEKAFFEIRDSTKDNAVPHSTNNDSIQSVFYTQVVPNFDEKIENLDNFSFDNELSVYMNFYLNLDYDEIYNSLQLVEKLCTHLGDFECRKQSVTESLANFSVPEIQHIKERQQLHNKTNTLDQSCNKSFVNCSNETGFALQRNVFSENANSEVTDLQKNLLNQPYRVSASHLQQKLNDIREASQSSRKEIPINATKSNVDSQGDGQCVPISIKTEPLDSLAPVSESASLNQLNTSHLYTSNHLQQGICDVDEINKCSQKKIPPILVDPEISMMKSILASLNLQNSPKEQRETLTNPLEQQASMLNSQFADLNFADNSMIRRKTPTNPVEPQDSMLNSQFILNSTLTNQPTIQRKTATNPVETETFMPNLQLTPKEILTNHIYSESTLKKSEDEHQLGNKNLTEFDSEASVSQSSLSSNSERFPRIMTPSNSENSVHIPPPVYSMQSESLSSAKGSNQFSPNFTHKDAVDFLNQTFTEISAINSNKNFEQCRRNGNEVSRNQSIQHNTKRKNRIDVREYLNRKKLKLNMEDSHVTAQNIVDKESLLSTSQNRLSSPGIHSQQQPSQDDCLAAKICSSNLPLVSSFTPPLDPRLKGQSANNISRSNRHDFPVMNPWQMSPQINDLTVQHMDIDYSNEFQHSGVECRPRSFEASFSGPIEIPGTPSFLSNNIGSRLCAPSVHNNGSQNFHLGLRSHEEAFGISNTPRNLIPDINYGVENINNHSSESRKSYNTVQSSLSNGPTRHINVVINRKPGLLPTPTQSSELLPTPKQSSGLLPTPKQSSGLLPTPKVSSGLLPTPKHSIDSTNFSPSLQLNIQNAPVRQVPTSFNETQSNNIVINPNNIVIDPNNIHSSSNNFQPTHSVLPSVPSNNIEVIQNPISSKRRQRSVSLIPQTLRNLIGCNYVTGSDLYLIIIEFNIDWFSEYEKMNDLIQFPPSILNKKELSQVKNNYKDEKEYYVIYFKLLLTECWYKMYISWKDMKFDNLEYVGKIHEYEAKNEFNKYVIEYFVRAKDGEVFPKESCIVLLRFTTLNRGTITMLGYVTSVMSRSFSLVYDKNHEAFQVLKCPPDNILKYKVTIYTVYKADDINIKEMVFTKKLLNVRKFLQQNDALNYVNKSELCKAIISPLSSPHVSKFSISSLSDVSGTMDQITKLVLNPDPLLALVNTPLGCPERMTAVSYLIEKVNESKPRSKVIICTKSENNMSRIGNELRKFKPVFICKEKIASLQKISLKKLVEKNLKASQSFDLIGSEEKKLAQEKVFMNSKVILVLLLGCHEQLHSLTKDLDVSCVILDEAHCCTEPESVVPLNYNVKKFILLGDQNCVCEGISPITSSYDYNRSLFNRAAL